MRIAVPLVDGKRCEDFEYCDCIALVDVDDQTRLIIARNDVVPLWRQPETLLPWFASLGVSLIIVGRMGSRAQTRFRQRGIVVLADAPLQEPEQLINGYLSGSLTPGANT